jgi:hypothetical protein
VSEKGFDGNSHVASNDVYDFVHDFHNHRTMVSALRHLASLPLLVVALSYLQSVVGIKFNLPAYRYPPQKCIWNTAHPNSLVIVTANVGPGVDQRVDIEIVDSSPNRNIYLSKKGIKAETRLAITTHGEGEVGVCLRNYVENGTCSIFGPYNMLNLVDLRPPCWKRREEQTQSRR